MCIGVAAMDFKKSTCSLVQISVNSSLVDFLPVCASTLKTLQLTVIQPTLWVFAAVIFVEYFDEVFPLKTGGNYILLLKQTFMKANVSLN